MVIYWLWDNILLEYNNHENREHIHPCRSIQESIPEENKDQYRASFRKYFHKFSQDLDRKTDKLQTPTCTLLFKKKNLKINKLINY